MSGALTNLRPSLSRFIDTVILVGGLLLLWQMVHQFAGATAMTAPIATIRYCLNLITGADFWPHAVTTMTAFAAALAIAVIFGTLAGTILGFHRLSGEVAEPILVALYSVPKVTLYPIILLVFGLGISAQIAFGALHGIVPIMIFTMNAVRNIRPVLTKTARVLNLRSFDLLRHVLLPATLPEIFTGLRVGFSVTLIGTLIAEMFGSKRGLGFLLMNALGINNMELIMALTLLLVVFAAFSNSILMAVEKRLYRRA